MSTSPKRRFRVGLVGAGYVSSYHIRALRALNWIDLVAIADLDFDRARIAAERYKIPAAYRTVAEMAEVRPEVIHVLTPPSAHCRVSLEALEMGCHVFVEKPMAMSVEECDRMIAKAGDVRRVLSVNHSARLDPIVQKALTLVEEGTIGEILAVDFLRSSSYPAYSGGPLPVHYRDGGYPFRDLGVHGLCMMEAFLGEILELDVSYRSTEHDPNLLFDEWQALVHCEKGTGHIQLSWNVRPLQSEVTVRGTKGILRLDRFLQTCTVQHNLPLPKSAQRICGAAAAAVGALWKLAWNGARFATGALVTSPGIQCSIQEFYRCLSQGRAPVVTPHEGRQIVYWAEKAALPADADKERRLHHPDNLKEFPILVTGGSGFLGRHLVQRLIEANKRVRLLIRRGPPAWCAGDRRVSFINGDLGDPETVDRAVRGASLVYHLGAATSGTWTDFERGTVCGTKNVVASCQEHSVKRLVYVSSLSVLDYNALSPSMPVAESAPMEPHPERRGCYTLSKLLAERLVTEAAADRRLPVIILRPGQIFGPGAEKTSPYGTLAVGSRWIVVGDGSCALPLVYVEDVVDALVRAAGEGVEGSLFHLVDQEIVTQNQYLDAYLASVPEALQIYRLPRKLLYGAALLAEIAAALLRCSLPLTRYRLGGLKSLVNFDCTAARTGLGWVPRIGVQEGLRRTFPGFAARTPAVANHSEISTLSQTAKS